MPDLMMLYTSATGRTGQPVAPLYFVASRMTDGASWPQAARSEASRAISPSQSLLSKPPSRMTVPGNTERSIFAAASGVSDIGLRPDFSMIFDTTTRFTGDRPTTTISNLG